MQKRSNNNESWQVAASVAEQVATLASEQPQKNPAAVALGRMGGLKGGKARAKTLSKLRRRQIAKAAAEARWLKNRE
jgi:hypothetical protein